MAIDNSNIRRKNPINTNNLFLSPEQFKVQMGFANEYVNKVLNQTVILYEVDLEQTNTTVTYQEADFDNIIFKTPVELNVIFNLHGSELKTYDKSNIKGYYVKVGQLEFTIYNNELEANHCDIKRGDYIGLQVTPEHIEYFIVSDDGRVNYDNKHTLFGTVPFYRTIKCAVVSDATETTNI
jgi:hypothetical protein